jgi:hypothetical protein
MVRFICPIVLTRNGVKQPVRGNIRAPCSIPSYHGRFQFMAYVLSGFNQPEQFLRIAVIVNQDRPIKIDSMQELRLLKAGETLCR